MARTIRNRNLPSSARNISSVRSVAAMTNRNRKRTAQSRRSSGKSGG